MAGPGACRTYSIPEMLDMARSAGFAGLGQITIVAIAMAESGGQSCALNPSGASGILQFIPATATRVGLQDPRDAQASFAAAWRLSHSGADFHDWETYTNGAAQHFTGQVQQQLRSAPATSPTSSLFGFGSLADPITGAAGRVVGAGRAFGEGVQASGQVALGSLILLAGAGVLLYLLLHDTSIGRGALRVGRDVGRTARQVAQSAAAVAA